MNILQKNHFWTVQILSIIFFYLAIIGYAPTVKAAENIDTNRYFYNQLSDIQKEMYDTLYNLPEGKDTIKIPVSKFPKDMDSYEIAQTILNPVLCAVSEDNPDYVLKWRYTSGYSSVDNGVFSFTQRKSQINENTLKKSKDTMSRWIAAIGEGDRYTKLRKIYDIMANNIEYDYDGCDYLFNRALDYNCSVVGSTAYGLAICEGYSATFKKLCDAADIPCIKVGNYCHGWNYVQMEDGKWYAVDTTSAQPHTWEQKLLLGMNDKHYYDNYGSTELYLGSPDFGFTWPELSDDNYVYTGNTTDFSYTIPESTFKEENGHFVYTKNDDGTWSITDYCGKATGSLVIPKEYQGKPVTTIGEAAFYLCSGFTGKLIIPDTIKEIGRMAFARCSGLSGKLTLPNQLTKVGESAFVRCSNLENEVSVPKTCTIDDYAFYFNGKESAKIIKYENKKEDKIHNNKEKIIINKGIITINNSNITYNGKKQTPSVKVTDSSGNIIGAGFYSITYKNNKNVGKATIEITFKNNYSGKLTKTFTIKPPKTKISKIIKSSKSVTVKWKKQTKQTTGYQIQYARNKKFKSAKKITIKNKKKTSSKIKKLKKNKKYYVRIRTYKTVKINGKKTKIYSNWSKVKPVKTKK